jgi:hypothetical protein
VDSVSNVVCLCLISLRFDLLTQTRAVVPMSQLLVISSFVYSFLNLCPACLFVPGEAPSLVLPSPVFPPIYSPAHLVACFSHRVISLFTYLRQLPDVLLLKHSGTKVRLAKARNRVSIYTKTVGTLRPGGPIERDIY